MTTNKRHILLNGYVSPENYRSRSNGRSPQVPARDRAVHGISLLNQYSRILNHYDERPRLPPVTDEKGIYVRLISFGNDSNLLIVFYVQIMPDDFVMQLHRF